MELQSQQMSQWAEQSQARAADVQVETQTTSSAFECDAPWTALATRDLWLGENELQPSPFPRRRQVRGMKKPARKRNQAAKEEEAVTLFAESSSFEFNVPTPAKTKKRARDEEDEGREAEAEGRAEGQSAEGEGGGDDVFPEGRITRAKRRRDGGELVAPTLWYVASSGNSHSSKRA